MELLPFGIDYLTERMKEQAKEELGEDDEVRQKAIVVMKEFVRGQKNLDVADDESFYLAFLRKAKFDTEKGIRYFVEQMKDKKAYPEIFRYPDFSHIRKSALKKIVRIMPNRDRDGSTVIFIQFGHWNPSEMTFANVVLSLALTGIAAAAYEATQVCGVKIIVDGSGLSWRHAASVQIRYVYLVGRGLKSSIPIRVKSIHFVNEGIHLRFMWNIASFYVGTKVRERTHFHGQHVESLLKHVDPRVLPKEFGGMQPDDASFFTEHMDVLETIFKKRIQSVGYRWNC